jgi:hypothetical protein
MKVMTSEKGILSTLVIKDPVKKPPQSAAPLEMKAQTPAADAPEHLNDPKDKSEVVSGEKPVEKEVKSSEEPALDPEDHDLPERARRRIGKYSVAAKQEAALRAAAEAEAADSERFAEGLFNERELLRKRVAELEVNAPRETVKAPEDAKPDPQDKKYLNAAGEFQWHQFSDDNAAYAAKKAIADDRAAQRQEADSARAAQEKAAFEKRIEAAKVKNKDWMEVVSNSSVILPNEALQYIAQSEYGTDIAYFLAKNPDKAENIKALHPIRAIAELGKIETGFEKPAESVSAQAAATSKTVERQGAPAPITPIETSGSGSVVLDPAKMNFKQLRAYEREKGRSRR